MDSTLDENQSSNVLRRNVRSINDGTGQERRFWHVRSMFGQRVIPETPDSLQNNPHCGTSPAFA
jgi:hypothetical protein